MSALIIGDLVYATPVSGPTVGIVIDLVNNQTFPGVRQAVVWWADNGETTIMDQGPAASLKKAVDKFR